MIYRVSIVPRARHQLLDAALWWSDNRSIEQAVRWLDGFESALQTLADDPGRLPLADDSVAFPVLIRQLLYGLGRTKTHRALFEIRGDEVIVHAVRHLAQADLADDFGMPRSVGIRLRTMDEESPMDQPQLTQPPRVPRQYGGQWIAWNHEQSRIVASGPTLQSALEAAIASGELHPLLTKAPEARTRFVGGLR